MARLIRTLALYPPLPRQLVPETNPNPRIFPPPQHFNNILGVDNHYESGFEAELGMSPDTSIQYPFCSWRYMYSQLSRDSSAWNVAFPDQNSIYHAMLVYFNKDDEFVIKGPNIPYVRYFSLQTYDPSAASIDSKIDYQLRTEYNSGSNAYSNATCGEAGDPQGELVRSQQKYPHPLPSSPRPLSLSNACPSHTHTYFLSLHPPPLPSPQAPLTSESRPTATSTRATASSMSWPLSIRTERRASFSYSCACTTPSPTPKTARGEMGVSVGAGRCARSLSRC